MPLQWREGGTANRTTREVTDDIAAEVALRMAFYKATGVPSDSDFTTTALPTVADGQTEVDADGQVWARHSGGAWNVTTPARNTVRDEAQGWLAQTFDRKDASTVTLATGVLIGGIVGLEAGRTCTNIITMQTTAATQMTHGWMGIMDAVGAIVAISHDSPGSWGGTGLVKLPLAAPYTPTLTGGYYLFAGMIRSGGVDGAIWGITPGGTPNLGSLDGGMMECVTASGITTVPANPQTYSVGTVIPWLAVK